MQAIDNSDMDLSEVEIDQAVFDLKSFGTCRADALYGLIKRGYAECYKKWVKPIPWAIMIVELSEAGEQRALSVSIENLAKPVNGPFTKTDPFQLSEVGSRYTGHLIFSEPRIGDLIASGHAAALARTCEGDVALGTTDASRAKSFPEFFSEGEGAGDPFAGRQAQS